MCLLYLKALNPKSDSKDVLLEKTAACRDLCKHNVARAIASKPEITSELDAPTSLKSFEA